MDHLDSAQESVATRYASDAGAVYKQAGGQSAGTLPDWERPASTSGVGGEDSQAAECGSLRPGTPKLDRSLGLDPVPKLWLEDEYHCDLSRVCDVVALSAVRRDYRARRGRTDWYRLEGEW